MEVEFYIKVSAPAECTEDELQEWVEFQTGYTGFLSKKNPLSSFELVAKEVRLKES